MPGSSSVAPSLAELKVAVAEGTKDIAKLKPSELDVQFLLHFYQSLRMQLIVLTHQLFPLSQQRLFLLEQERMICAELGRRGFPQASFQYESLDFLRDSADLSLR